MKKLLIIATSVAVCLAACYKQQKPPQAFDVLTRHQWKIDAHIYADVDTGADCKVPSEVEFSKDSTGYFYYTTPCDSGDAPKKTFRWTITPDNENIYFTDLEGKSGTFHNDGISAYDDNILRLRGLVYNGHYWDGYFKAFGPEKK